MEDMNELMDSLIGAVKYWSARIAIPKIESTPLSVIARRPVGTMTGQRRIASDRPWSHTTQRVERDPAQSRLFQNDFSTKTRDCRGAENSLALSAARRLAMTDRLMPIFVLHGARQRTRVPAHMVSTTKLPHTCNGILTPSLILGCYNCAIENSLS